MEADSGQTGITVSCILHIIHVYLKKNTIRIIMTRMQKKFQSLNVIDQVIIIIIHIFMVGFHGNKIYQMKRKLYATSWYMVAMDFLTALNFFDFFNQTVQICCISSGNKVETLKYHNKGWHL